MGHEVRLRVGGSELEVEAWPFRVGRADVCELVVDDARLARVQLVIDRVPGRVGWSISALGPAPVRVNGIQIGGDLVLRNGDRIESGSFHAVFIAPETTPVDGARDVRAGAVDTTPGPASPRGDRPHEVGVSGVASVSPPPKTRRFITTGGVSRATRPPRAPAALAVGMALLVAGATALFATAARQMSIGDGPADPLYAARPIDIAARAARDPLAPVSALPPARSASGEVPVAAERPREDPAPEPEPIAPSRRDPPPAEHAPGGAPPPEKAVDEEHGEATPPDDGRRDGSVTPAEDPPRDPGGSGEVRIPIFGEEVWGKNIAFVVDRSGSMAPVWIGVRNELVATLRLLTPDHKFSLVLYSNELSVLSEGWTSGTPAMIERAIAWTEGVPARGATDPEPAVEHALRLPGLDALILMSDIRFKGARMDRTVELLRRATQGTKTFKAIKLYFFPLEENESTARISALSSGSPSAAFKLRSLR